MLHRYIYLSDAKKKIQNKNFVNGYLVKCIEFYTNIIRRYIDDESWLYRCVKCYDIDLKSKIQRPFTTEMENWKHCITKVKEMFHGSQLTWRDQTFQCWSLPSSKKYMFTFCRKVFFYDWFVEWSKMKFI